MNLIDRLMQDSRDGYAAKLFDATRKVVIHRDVVKAALELSESSADKIPEIAKFTCWPDYNTWIETQKDSDKRLGFLFYGKANNDMSVIVGYGMVFIEYEDGFVAEIPVRYDLEKYVLEWDAPFKSEADVRHVMRNHSYEEQEHAVAAYMREYGGDPIALHAKHAPVLAAIKPFLFALLAFMNSPKIITYHEPDLTKLNNRRVKRGKYPFHPHHEIRMNIDQHRLNITPPTGEGSERGQYFVRAHLRFLVHPRYKNVSVTLVEPHYRGNPEIGMRNTSYAVERQHSTWPVE